MSNQSFSDYAPDPAPPTHEERILTEKSQALLYDFRRARDKAFGEYDTFRNTQNEERADLALLQRQLSELTDGRLPKINATLVESVGTKIEKAKGRIVETAAKREADEKQRGTIPLTEMEEWLSRQTKPLRDRGTTDELREGMTAVDMHNLYGNEIVRLTYSSSAAESTYLPRAEIIARITRDVADLRGRVNTDRVKYMQRRFSGKARQGTIEWPTIRIDGSDQIDAMAIVLNAPSFRKELTDVLIAQALTSHDEKHAVSPAQREENIATTKAELLNAEYLAAFWWRKLADDGHQVAVKTSRPECLLDVEH